MYGDESIYNLIPYEYSVRERSPQRIPKKSHKTQEVTGSTFGKFYLVVETGRRYDIHRGHYAHICMRKLQQTAHRSSASGSVI